MALFPCSASVHIEQKIIVGLLWDETLGVFDARPHLNLCCQDRFLIQGKKVGVITEMLLTQFSPVAAGLRPTAGLSGAEQAFTCDPDSAGVTGQGLTCDSWGRRDLGKLK